MWKGPLSAAGHGPWPAEEWSIDFNCMQQAEQEDFFVSQVNDPMRANQPRACDHKVVHHTMCSYAAFGHSLVAVGLPHPTPSKHAADD